MASSANVKHESIKTLSDQFVALRTDVHKILNDLDTLWTSPGNFDVGWALQQQVANRRKELQGALVNLWQALSDISQKLSAIATKYEGTANDTTVTAAELNAMVTELKGTLDGIMLESSV